MRDTEYHLPIFGVCFVLTICVFGNCRRARLCFLLIFSPCDDLTKLLGVVLFCVSIGNPLGESITSMQVSYHRHIVMLAPSLNRAWCHGVWEMGMCEP